MAGLVDMALLSVVPLRREGIGTVTLSRRRPDPGSRRVSSADEP